MPQLEPNIVEQLALQIQLMPLNVAVGVAAGYIVGRAIWGVLAFGSRKVFGRFLQLEGKSSK